MASEERGLEPEKVEKAREFLCTKLASRFIILFGSAATGKGFGPYQLITAKKENSLLIQL